MLSRSWHSSSSWLGARPPYWLRLAPSECRIHVSGGLRLGGLVGAGHVHGVRLYAAEVCRPGVRVRPFCVDDAFAEGQRRHVPAVGVAGRLGFGRLLAGGQLRPVDGERVLGDVARGERVRLVVLHPEVAALDHRDVVGFAAAATEFAFQRRRDRGIGERFGGTHERRLLLVGAERDVVDVRRAGNAAVLRRHRREFVAGGVGEPGRESHLPAGADRQHARGDADDERVRLHVHFCLQFGARDRLARGDFEQLRVLCGDDQRVLDAGRAELRVGRPFFPGGGCRGSGREGPLGDRHVGVRQRVPVDAPVGGLRRVADGGGEDVRAVFVGRPFRVHEAAVDLGERRDFRAVGDSDRAARAGRDRRRGSRSTGSPRPPAVPCRTCAEKSLGNGHSPAEGSGSAGSGAVAAAGTPVGRPGNPGSLSASRRACVIAPALAGIAATSDSASTIISSRARRCTRPAHAGRSPDASLHVAYLP